MDELPPGVQQRAPVWFAFYTKARHEKQVAVRLGQRGWEIYLPLVARLRHWHDRSKVVLFPFFPGYLFIRLRLNELTDALGVPGVVSVIRLASRPTPVPDEEIENVRRLEQALATSETEGVELGPLIEEGQPVRVSSGPLKGVRGVVLERRGGGRTLVQVGVRAIGQGIKIELEATSLATIDEEAA